MQIGALAKRLGLTVDAIRFYERCALLPHPQRSLGGFRLYGESDVHALAFIRRVQALGFSLAEIRELLEMRGLRLQPCARVRRRLERKLHGIRTKLADLHRLERDLIAALRTCDRGLRVQPRRCPLLSETSLRPKRIGK
jgi:DNA-binding transcriptional MerR regulator